MDLKKWEAFKAAKKIAFSVSLGSFRRAKVDGQPVNFVGFKSLDGNSYVIGDTTDDLYNSKIFINGRPARQVFQDFSIIEA